MGTTVSSIKGDVILEWEADQWELQDMDADGEVLYRFAASSKVSTRWSLAHDMTKAAMHVAKAAVGEGQPTREEVQDAMTKLHR